MEKSFLELLEEEKKTVYEVKFFKESAQEFMQQADVWTNAKEDCKKIARQYESRCEKAEEKLLEIRKELKQYISFLTQL